MKILVDHFREHFEIELINAGDDNLNEGCGAEFVQKDKKVPVTFAQPNVKGMSFDGDADRIVYL